MSGMYSNPGLLGSEEQAVNANVATAAIPKKFTKDFLIIFPLLIQ